MKSQIDALPVETVARRLGCEPETLNELAARGQVPAVKFGRSWRFPAAALNQHLFDEAMKNLRRETAPARAANEPSITMPSTERKIKRTRPDLTRTVKAPM